jgi:hypothetical protein
MTTIIQILAVLVPNCSCVRWTVNGASQFSGYIYPPYTFRETRDMKHIFLHYPKDRNIKENRNLYNEVLRIYRTDAESIGRTEQV